MLHIELEWKHAYQIKYYKLFHQIQIPCSYTFFCCCCCVGVKECSLAALMMRPAPILALTTAKLEEEEKEKGQEEQVPRVYIKTLLDRVMKPEQQDAMIRRWPPSQVYELESDHSPFFSNPFVLFGLLIKAAVSVGSI